MRWPLKRNRQPTQRRQERELWEELRAAWGPLRERAWQIIDLPQVGARVIEEIGPNQWDWLTWDMLDRLADELSVQLIGGARMTGTEYAVHQNAVLARAGRTGFAIGVDRAVQLTQAGESALPMRGSAAAHKFMLEGFDRLCDGGRLRLANILRPGTDYPQSVQSILQAAMQEGENPIKTARTLAARFDQYERWEFARLARTEVAFAQNRGQAEEWQAEGYVLPVATEDNPTVGGVAGELLPPPPFHPNCICGIVPDPETGLVRYDIAATACAFCQEMLAYELTVVTGEPTEPREPVE